MNATTPQDLDITATTEAGVSGTVKGHGAYQGQDQTHLFRAKVEAK